MEAEFGCRLAENRRTIRFLLRRRRVFACTRILEWIPARHFLAVQMPSLAAGAEQVFEPIVVRFEIVGAHAPILHGDFRREEFLAVALFRECALAEIGVLEAIGLSVPVHRRTAQAGARQETFPTSDRQRGLRTD